MEIKFYFKRKKCRFMFLDKANVIPILSLNKLLFHYRKTVNLTRAWKE